MFKSNSTNSVLQNQNPIKRKSSVSFDIKKQSLNQNIITSRPRKKETKKLEPSAVIPKISLPKFPIPKFTLPELSLPKINLSKVNFKPLISFKSIASLNRPELRIKKPTLPKLSIPISKVSEPCVNAIGHTVKGLGSSTLKTVTSSVVLSSGIFAIVLGKIFSIIKFAASALASVFYLIFNNILGSVKGVLRFFIVLTARWMRIHGSHGAPHVGARRLRMIVVTITMVFMSAGVVARLYALQGIQHGKWNKIASKQHGTGVEVEGARGVIYDRNGLKLAVSIPAMSVSVHPKWIKNKEEAAQKIAQAIEIPSNDILAKLNEDKTFVNVAKGVSIAKKKQLESLKLYGLEIEEEFNRVYPQGDLASTIIGKAGKDGIGLSGVERALNPSLVAPAVKLVANRDARGKLMNSAVWSEESEASLQNTSLLDSNILTNEELRKEGASIALTIDSTIQRYVEEEFDKAKETAKAKNVFGLMMDAESGEILAMGQTSRYNPNENKNISTEALRNVVLQNSFEPGSTFKPIVAAIALDKGLTSKDEMINCENGKYGIGKRLIRDAHPVPTVTFEQVIVRSSNIGMAKLGFRLGKESLYNNLSSFGFGQKTGIELSGESNGIMRHSDNWAQIDIATHSFGQGVSVTALQIARAYSALANGGVLVTPSILKSANRDNNYPRLISEKTASVIKRALNQVTEDEHGTGHNSRISGVPVYGKTGTAQKARDNGRGYDPDKILASFIGFVDGRVIGVQKTLVLYVAVDEPGVTPRWGGTLAAPVFKNVMERTLSYLLSQRNTTVDSQFVEIKDGVVQSPLS